MSTESNRRMPQTVLKRSLVSGISVVLLSALGLFASMAYAQPPSGQPSSGGPGYAPQAPPGAARQAYAPPYQAAPSQTGPSAARYPTAGSSQGNPSPNKSFRQGPLPPTKQQAATPPRQAPLNDLFTPAKIVARVGDQTILAGDLIGDVNQMLEPYKGQAPEEELDKQRVVLMRTLLKRLIETKLVYLEFLRKVPPEQLPTVEANLAKAFDEEQLDEMIERAEVANAAELDAKLREYGTSLAKQRKRFGEQYLAQMIVRQSVDYDPEITHREMLKYYEANADQYAIAAKVKWEHLMASFEKQGSEQAAYGAIAAMGNEVVGGAPLDAVAKRSSNAADAFEGGLNESTTQGALVWEEVDATLFSIPPNRLSKIIKTDDGFHIVRVLERTEASKESFVEAQVEIKAQLKKKKIKAQADKYLEKVKSQTPVWTIFDDMPAEVAEGQSFQELMRR